MREHHMSWLPCGNCDKWQPKKEIILRKHNGGHLDLSHRKVWEIGFLGIVVICLIYKICKYCIRRRLKLVKLLEESEVLLYLDISGIKVLDNRNKGRSNNVFSKSTMRLWGMWSKFWDVAPEEMFIKLQCNERFLTYFQVSVFFSRCQTNLLSLCRSLNICSLEIWNSRTCCTVPTTHGCCACVEKLCLQCHQRVWWLCWLHVD